MSFEKYLDINYNEKLDDLTKFLINDAFKSGAQSRQAEIDDLIDIVKTSADSEMHLFDELQKVKKERNELQKRIANGVVSWVSLTSIAVTHLKELPDEFYQKLDELHENLIGKEND